MWRLELDFEVAPDLLVKIVQLEDQVPLGAIFRDLLPFKHLCNEVTVVKLVVIDALHPLDVLENGLDCVLFHIGDDDVKAGELLREGPKTDRMEVHNFIPHVFEDPIEGKIVVLSEAQLKESHLFLFLISYFTELVMQEATEKLDIALLRIDRKSLSILGATLVIMSD